MEIVNGDKRDFQSSHNPAHIKITSSAKPSL